jgi:hypothetical protein
MLFTSLYASLLAFIFLILTYKVIKIRKSNHITIGDNNNLALQRAIRAHGNFTETVPLALILLALAEYYGASIFILHIGGLSLLIGRMTHGYAISHIQENLNLRKIGMILTLFSILFLSVVNLSHIII